MATFATIQSVRDAFGWNATAQRYTDRVSGRFVRQSAVDRAISGNDGVIFNARREIEVLAEQVADGTIGIGEWQLRMAGAIKNLDIATVAAGRGGIAQLTQADYGRIGQRLRDEYARLESFARDMEAGRIKGRRIVQRALLYANRRNGVYQNARRDGAAAVYAEERRVRSAADSCPTCFDQAALGWQPAGTLLPLGASECKMNCLCSFRFRNPRK